MNTVFFSRGADATRGFSLLELLLVIALLAIIGSMGSAYYFAVVKNVELSTTAATVISDLKHAQANAMAGDSGVRWGIHFVHTPTDNYYQLFSTPVDFSSTSTTITSATYLPSQIIFTDPPVNTTKDVLFERITGTTTPTTISLFSSDTTRVITLPAVGSAY